MNLPMGPFSDRPDLDELAHLMFRQFSRMEYALKATGYLKQPGGNVQADWDSFAAKIDAEFRVRTDGDPILKDAVDYLTAQPPKKQVFEQGGLGWRDVIPTSATRTGVLLLCVARVRNNLFHGGKFNGNWLDPERSGDLIPRCLVVLDACLAAAPDVRTAFES